MKTMDLELKKILDKYEYAGISVLHATKEGVDFHMCLGKQDIEENIDTNENTIYRIASVSKIIVALIFFCFSFETTSIGKSLAIPIGTTSTSIGVV